MIISKKLRLSFAVFAITSIFTTNLFSPNEDDFNLKNLFSPQNSDPTTPTTPKRNTSNLYDKTISPIIEKFTSPSRDGYTQRLPDDKRYFNGIEIKRIVCREIDRNTGNVIEQIQNDDSNKKEVVIKKINFDSTDIIHEISPCPSNTSIENNSQVHLQEAELPNNMMGILFDEADLDLLGQSLEQLKSIAKDRTKDLTMAKKELEKVSTILWKYFFKNVSTEDEEYSVITELLVPKKNCNPIKALILMDLAQEDFLNQKRKLSLVDVIFIKPIHILAHYCILLQYTLNNFEDILKNHSSKARIKLSTTKTKLNNKDFLISTIRKLYKAIMINEKW